MAEDTYTLKEMLTEIKLDMREHNERAVRMEETTNAIFTQAKLTNGRVTTLEKVNENRAGALSLGKYLGLFASGLLLAYLGWLGNQVSDINKTLSAYQIEIQ